MKLAKDAIKAREEDIKSWTPYKWQGFLNVSGVLGLISAKKYYSRFLENAAFVRLLNKPLKLQNTIQDTNGNEIQGMDKMTDLLVLPLKSVFEAANRFFTDEEIKLYIRAELESSVTAHAAVMGYLAIISGICLYRASQYKQSFYRNAVAISSIIENAPVIA